MAVVAIVVICLSALLLGSVFGIFFAGEDTGTGQTIQTVVHEINSDYDNKLMSIRDKSSYDVLEMKEAVLFGKRFSRYILLKLILILTIPRRL